MLILSQTDPVRWVNHQRASKKALDRGDPRPGTTAARVAKLDELGFVWAVKVGPPV
jgi:hypothetical protein